MALRLLKYFLLLAAFFAASCLVAQSDIKVQVKGIIKNQEDHQRLAAVKITVFKNGNAVENTVTDHLGKYMINLDLGEVYEIRFAQAGFQTKSIRIDTQNVPEAKRIDTFILDFDGELFKAPPDFNPDVMKEPVATAKWDGKEKISIDPAQAERRKKEIEEEIERAIQAGKDPSAMQAEYDLLVKEGDAAMAAKTYQGAVDKYGAALKIFPKKDPALSKYNDAKAKLEKEQGDKAFEEKYAQLIKDGDALFATKSYQESRTKFVEANKMKPKEVYPKDKLVELDGLLAGDKLKADYDRIIGDADKKFNSKFLQPAIDAYKSALALMPDQQYPKDKIKEAEGLISTALEAGAKRQQYERFKDDGDLKFRAGKYDEAIALYEKALGVLPDEQYPKDQIVASNKAIEEKLYAEKKKQYDAIIVQADGKFNTKDFEGSITKYEEASVILPAEAYPGSQIALARKGIEDRDAAAKRKQYTDLVAKADNSFKSTDYENAIATYQLALDLFPSEVYPKEQIKAAQTAIFKKNEKELQAKYDGIIAKADQKFTATAYEESITLYEEASAIIPKETYPGKQIEKARSEMGKAKEKELRKQYDAFIAEGDLRFNSGKFEECITSYQSASDLITTEKYPKDKMAEAYKKMGAVAEERKKKEQYDALIADADLKFAAKDYGNCINVYEQASDLLPKEEYPKTQVTSAKALLAEYKKKKEQYDALIAKADGKFNSGDFKKSIELYTSASDVLPEEQYPRTQIIEATGKMDAEAAAKLKREEYERLMKEGDSRYDSKQYQLAIDSYKSALDLFPEETKPPQQINKCMSMMAVTDEPVSVKTDPKVIDRSPEQKRNGHTSKEVERLRSKWMKINNFRIANNEHLDEREAVAYGRSLDTAEKAREKKTVVKEKPEISKPEIIDEKTYTLGIQTITEYTVKKGESEKVFRKAVDKNHTYYSEIIPSTGKKWRDLIPQEWKRETGLEPDRH